MQSYSRFSKADEPYNWSSSDASEVEKAFDRLSPEAVKTLVTRAMSSEEEKQSADNFQSTTVPLFCKMYPAYIDNQHNSKLMQHHWRTKFNTEIPTLVQVEESYFDLRQAGVLNLNAAAVKKEDAARIAQHHDELIAARKEAEFDEAAAYTMPLDQLAAKARGWR
jgi:hypothetical protein